MTKLWAIQDSKLTKITGNSEHKSLFNATKKYRHTQPYPGWPRFLKDPKPFVRFTTELGKQPAKADH